MVTIYKRVAVSGLRVSKGDVIVHAKFLRVENREKAVDIPTFQQFIESENMVMKVAA
jgi:hypothetical protein